MEQLPDLILRNNLTSSELPIPKYVLKMRALKMTLPPWGILPDEYRGVIFPLFLLIQNFDAMVKCYLDTLGSAL